MHVALEVFIILLLLVAIAQRQIPISTINKLREELKKAMSELTDAVAAIANDVNELQVSSQRVIDMLSAPNPDVAGAIAALKAADAGFDAVTAGLNAAAGVTPPEPPTEPPTEG